MKTHRHTLTLLFKNWPTIFLFELIYKLAISTVFIPVGLWMLSMSIHIAGFNYVTEANALRWLGHPLTILFIVIAAFLLTAFSLFDISAIIYVTDASMQGKKVGLKQVVLFSLRNSRRVFARGTGLMIVQVLLILPFINLGGATGLITWIGIPEFSLLYVLKTPWLLLLVGTGIGFVVWVSCKWLYSFHFFTLEQCSFREARIRSKALHKGYKIKDLLVLILEQVLFLIIFAAITALIVLITMAISSLVSTKTLFFSLVMGVVIMLVSLLALLYMCLSVPISYTIISVMYYGHKERLGDEVIHAPIEQEQKPLSGRSKIIIGAIGGVCTCVMVVFSYLLFHGQINFNIENSKQVEIAAHRGLSDEYPENTMAAFQGAIDCNADWIELDVRLTSDGVPVVIHDKTLKRTGGLSKRICDMTWEEISQVDVGSWYSSAYAEERIPRLEQVIELAQRNATRLIIELKPYGTETNFAEIVTDVIHQYNFTGQCIVSSDHAQILRDIKDCDENIQTMSICTLALGDFSNSEVDAFCVESSFVTSQMVSQIHRAGKLIMVWTPDNQQLISRFIHMGVDCIVTDKVTLAKTLAYNAQTSDLLQDYIQLLLDVFYRGVNLPQL